MEEARANGGTLPPKPKDEETREAKKTNKEAAVGKTSTYAAAVGKGKGVVDPDKPQGPRGAYMLFAQAARPKLIISQPELKFWEIAKAGGLYRLNLV